MTFHSSGFKSIAFMGTPSNTPSPGSRPQWHTYVTNDTKAQIEAAEYFDALLTPAKKIKAGDFFDVLFDLDGTPGRATYQVSIVSSHVVLVPSGEDRGGVPRSITATTDGLTTGLILGTDDFVEVTSADANHIVTLPTATAATRGREIWIWVLPSTNCELRTPAASGQTINNVDSDGSAEALLTHTQLYICRQHLATGWLLQAITALGAVATAIVPD